MLFGWLDRFLLVAGNYERSAAAERVSSSITGPCPCPAYGGWPATVSSMSIRTRLRSDLSGRIANQRAMAKP